MALRICSSWSLAIISCCIDIDSIFFYLLSEEGANVFVTGNEVYIAAKQSLQVLGGCNIVIEFRWHGDKEVDITSLLVTVPSYRAKKSH